MAINLKERIKEAPKKKWIRFVIVSVLCLSFVVWSGYYLLLLSLPFFFDAHITKVIPWGFWRNSKNDVFRTVMDWVDAIVFALVAVYFINTFFFQNYQIPTSSLEKSLLVGDFLFVNKMSYGSRSPMTPISFPLAQHTLPILDCKSYIDIPQVAYKRLSGLGSIERGNIVVFNFPAGDTVALKLQASDYYALCKQNPNGAVGVRSNKSFYGDIVYRPVDRRENYVKRCIGLPGETLEVKNDVVYIDNQPIKEPENVQFTYLIQTDGTYISPAVFDELGISKEDQSYVNVLKNSESDLEGILSASDSTLRVKTGLKWNAGNLGVVYHRVNLTKAMLEQLKKKPFVLSVVRENLFLKNLGVKTASNVYPINYDLDWEQGDFPALWIPKKGSTITFDGNLEYKVAAYERCIKNYEHNDFDYRNGKVYINGNEAKSYTFKFDYYFMMGDNRDNSADSRAWGFVPEDHVVGRPMFVWLSLDKDKGWFSGKIRWNRLFKSAKID